MASVGRCSTSRLSISSSIMPGLLVRMPDRYGHAAQSVDVQIERRRVDAEQLPQRRLAAERIAHAAEVDERRVRLGRGGDGGEQPRGDRRQEVPAAARREEANLLGRQRHQVLIRGRARRRTDSGRALAAIRSGGGSGSCTRSTSGSVVGVAGEGVVQQVVENLAVHASVRWA